MKQFEKYFIANKDLWNKKTLIHKASSFYDLKSFRNGRSSLKAVELEELGDIKGKSILHLQCHFGMDTLSLARLGARVTGIDLSNEAIETARKLNDELGLDAKFYCSNIYDLPDLLEEKFDIVFTSYGVIAWLPDLDKWAAIIVHFLKKGGTFYMAEFHPVLWMLDEHLQHVKYHYHNQEMYFAEHNGTYADRNANIKGLEYSWNHSIGEVLNPLIQQGLRIEHFHEFSYSPFNCFSNLVKGKDGNWRVKGLENKIPMMFTVKAVKK